MAFYPLEAFVDFLSPNPLFVFEAYFPPEIFHVSLSSYQIIRVLLVLHHSMSAFNLLGVLVLTMVDTSAPYRS